MSKTYKQKMTEVAFVVCDFCDKESQLYSKDVPAWFTALPYVYTIEDHGRERDYEAVLHSCGQCNARIAKHLDSVKAALAVSESKPE